MGDYHPECPARLQAIEEVLRSEGLDSKLIQYEAPLASNAQLSQAHSSAYIAALERAAPSRGTVHLDPDTSMNPHSWQAALRSAGAGVHAVDLVMAGEVDNAFCAVRPPGHHAEKSRAMGFCFFNNIAVAACHALEEHALRRVAIVDFDVHHGNGSEDIFADDERVLMCGCFQHPFYPYSGATATGENMCNVPLEAGSDGEDLRQAANDIWLHRLDDFAPQMFFISAGFDAHYADTIGGLRFTEEDYAWCTRFIKQLAAKSAQGRIVSMLEGGYNLEALASSVIEHLQVLAE